jgi:hypothetical protein
LPDVRDLLEIERLVLPSSPAPLIENLCNLAIAVMIQEAVDFGDDFRLRLPNLSDRQRLGQGETSSGAATEPYMDLDLLSVD